MKRPENTYPPRMLRLIKQQLEKNIDGPLDYSYGTLDEIAEVLKKFGIIDISHEEYGFWINLVQLNKGKTEDQELVIPKIQKFYVNYSMDMRKYITEYWRKIVFSYGEEPFIRDQINSDDNFDYYDGEFLDDYVDDSDTTSYDIETIEKIPDDKSSLKEHKYLSDQKRMEEIKDLQKMKKVIEQRLKVLTS